MKIISGFLKGRVVSWQEIKGTRPTMDRVKESLFAMIQGYVKDSVVLDLFSGSGNLGFEAISNGARFCYFNDISKRCTKSIISNVKEFHIEDKVEILNYDYKRALAYFKENAISFDLIFLDPPYEEKIQNDIIDYIKENQLLNHQGIIICEVDQLYLNVDCYQKIKEKKYGDKYIVIYKNIL